MQFETLSDGARRFAAGRAAFVVRRLEPGAVGVVASGIDRDEVGALVVRELSAELQRFPTQLELYVDAREVEQVSLEARATWTTWLRRNRSRLRRVHMLTSHPSVELGAAIAGHDARAKLVTYRDPRAFEDALRSRAAELGQAELTIAGVQERPIEGGVSLDDGACGYEVTAPKPGTVLVRVRGNDRGVLLSHAWDATLGRFVPGRRPRLFFDLRQADMPLPRVSRLWSDWFSANRARLDSVLILATARAVSVTAGIATWRSRTGGLIRLTSNPQAFEAAMSALPKYRASPQRWHEGQK